MKTRTSITGKLFFSVLMTILMTMALVSSPPAFGDNAVSSGTTLRVSAGTTLVSVGTLTLKSGSILNNQGTIVLNANFDNQNPGSTDLGTGTLVLNGTSLQTVNGTNTTGALTMNNAAGAALNGSMTINTALTLTMGLISIGANNLTLGTVASVAGSPSATAMVVATGTGEFRKSFSGIGSFTFPVGDNTGSAEYSPVSVTFNSGSFAGGNYSGVNLVDAIYPGSPGTGSFITRYWNISQSGITSFNANAVLQYLAADVNGTESQIYCVRIAPPTIDYFNAANTGLHQLSANGISKFGTFTGYQVLTDKSTTLTVLLEGYWNGTNMNQAKNADAGGSTWNNFPGTTVDTLSIYLASATSPWTTLYGVHALPVSTAGSVSLTSPGLMAGNYYVVIKHRQSIETWSASPVSYSGSSITYNFTTSAGQAFGSNMKALGSYWGLYAGDVTQNGYVELDDVNSVYTSQRNSAYGYLTNDINGNGFVELDDVNKVYTNSRNSVGLITPPHPVK